jgi:hypothetical protein
VLFPVLLGAAGCSRNQGSGGLVGQAGTGVVEQVDSGYVTWPAVQRDEAFLCQAARRFLHAPRAGVLGMAPGG